MSDSLAQTRIVELRTMKSRTTAQAEELALLEEYVSWNAKDFDLAQEKERAKRLQSAIAKDSAAPAGSDTGDKV